MEFLKWHDKSRRIFLLSEKAYDLSIVLESIDNKEKNLALKSVLTTKVAENKFIVVDGLSFDEIKTKNMVNVLKNLEVKKALVVTDDDNKNVTLSSRNIPGVKTAFTNTINVYDILKYDKMVVAKDVISKIEEVYA